MAGVVAVRAHEGLEVAAERRELRREAGQLADVGALRGEPGIRELELRKARVALRAPGPRGVDLALVAREDRSAKRASLLGAVGRGVDALELVAQLAEQRLRT